MMNKLVQRGATTALRVRSLGSAPDISKFTPEQIVEMGRKINPAQTTYGPKSPTVEKWQKHFQDPLLFEVPIYKRKGVSDDMLLAVTSITVGSIFIYNVVDFIRGF